MASNVDIAEDARFKFQIIQPVLNHIAYANNANQPAVVKHRHDITFGDNAANNIVARHH